jgi:hypothetical protein
LNIKPLPEGFRGIVTGFELSRVSADLLSSHSMTPFVEWMAIFYLIKV